MNRNSKDKRLHVASLSKQERSHVGCEDVTTEKQGTVRAS